MPKFSNVDPPLEIDLILLFPLLQLLLPGGKATVTAAVKTPNPLISTGSQDSGLLPPTVTQQPPSTPVLKNVGTSFIPSILNSFHPFLHSFCPSIIHCLHPSFILSILHSFPHPSFILSILHSFPPPFIHSLHPSFVLSIHHSFIHSFSPSFIHSFPLHLFFILHSFPASFIHEFSTV